MEYHLTNDVKALTAEAGTPFGKALCGTILSPKGAIIGAIMLSDHDNGCTHFLHKILCERCKNIADSRRFGVYRGDGRAF